MDLEDRLTKALRGTIEAAKEKGFVPVYFSQMLDRYDGKETAKRLLASSKAQTGLFQLYDLGILADSMEAIILRDEYSELFTKGELEEAKKRLERLRYFDNRKL